MPLASMQSTKDLCRDGSWDGQFMGFKDALTNASVPKDKWHLCLRCHLQRQNVTYLVCHCPVGILFTKCTKKTKRGDSTYTSKWACSCICSYQSFLLTFLALFLCSLWHWKGNISESFWRNEMYNYRILGI